MLTFFERLDKYMKIKQLNDNKITVEAGISNGLIGKGRKRGAISQENISKILQKYTDLNANWLLTGEGEMLKKEHQPNTNIGHSGNNSKITGNIEINTFQSDLEKANIRIEYLEKIIKDKEKIIELLTKK
ncbi:MAG: hypothetical protein LBN95_09805 [Prevotellaceae bacterium]|jgi:hypothetical protein|nr:hypothetical protein [Prevotellaceae bacterium]